MPDQRMELSLSSAHCLFSCVQTRRSGIFQKRYRSPDMPVGRNFTATAVVCLQTLIRFVRFLTCCFCHTLCAPNAFRTLIPHAFLECVLPMGRPTVARTVTIKVGFQSARFGFRKTSNYIFIHCLCFVPQVFYSIVLQAFHFQTSKSANHLLSANCTHHAATALKQRHSHSFHFL